MRPALLTLLEASSRIGRRTLLGTHQTLRKTRKRCHPFLFSRLPHPPSHTQLLLTCHTQPPHVAHAMKPPDTKPRSKTFHVLQKTVIFCVIHGIIVQDTSRAPPDSSKDVDLPDDNVEYVPHNARQPTANPPLIKVTCLRWIRESADVPWNHRTRWHTGIIKRWVQRSASAGCDRRACL